MGCSLEVVGGEAARARWSAGHAGQPGTLVSMDDVDVTEAHRAALADEVLLLDVREDDEWAAGRAPGALHVPMQSLRQDTLPRDRPVYALCRVGGRSAAVAEALASIGYDVANVTGGMQAWAATGLPVVRDEGAPGTVL
jgi:rhodanese-related sulfurtransferase